MLRIQLIIISAVIIVSGLTVFAFRRSRRRKSLVEDLLVVLPAIQNALQDWQEFLSQATYLTHLKVAMWSERNQDIAQLLPSRKHVAKLPLDSTVTNAIISFIEIFECYEELRKDRNEAYVVEELQKYKQLFQFTLSPSLSEAQQKAILHDEENTLVVAGAGTGKTTTLIGKAAYLIEADLARPNEILAVAFTTKVAQEMEDRLLQITRSIKKMGEYPVKVKTFHALGYEIIGAVAGVRPDLIFNGDERNTIKFLTDCLDSIWENARLASKIRAYFLYQLKPAKVSHEFEDKNDYIQYVKGHGLRTIDDRFTVKSFEELLIANSLWENGINYEYEYTYPKADTRTQDKSFYKPDFYLPDYDIYIEHFAVDRDGNVPPFFRGEYGLSAREYYWSGIKWKRQIHKKYYTTLIETYSYEIKNGTLIDSLINKLLSFSVELNIRSDSEVQQMCKSSKYTPFLVKLIFTFMNLMKSNQQTISELKRRAELAEDARTLSFLDIFTYLHDKYDKKLRLTGTIDYADMINNATQAVSSGQYVSPYKYILIDEFQDMSVGRYQLIKALRIQNKDTKLFCVGDDWQSIFRFTGSDISLMTQFEKYFGFTYRAILNETHRLNKEICDATNQFIQTNPNQLKKNLQPIHESRDESFSIIEVPDGDYQQRINNIIVELYQSKSPGKRVLILGRYKESLKLNIEKHLRKSGRDIECLTVHKAKGLTCDYTILTEVNAGKYGFPAKIADDPVLFYVLHEADQFEDGEERRLFYVALTRARNGNYILTDPTNKSQFVMELESILGLDVKEGMVLCPECGVPMIRKAGPYGDFYGCSNYPNCEESMSTSVHDGEIQSQSRAREYNEEDDGLPF